jgi:serine/threonine-protein kinase RIO1
VIVRGVLVFRTAKRAAERKVRYGKRATRCLHDHGSTSDVEETNDVFDDQAPASALETFYADEWITEVIQVLKSGKEATAYLCASHPSRGVDLLTRDVANLCRCFARYGVVANAEGISNRLWRQFVRGELSTEPTWRGGDVALSGSGQGYGGVR